MPRAGLSPDAVVDIAVDHVDDQGPAALTLAAVAARAGVATPSLYKHVGSLAELRSLVSLRGWRELTEQIADAVIGRSGEQALRGLLLAYRSYVSYVVEHPNRYRALHQAPLSDPRTAAADDRLMGIVLAVLRGFGLEGPAAIHAARCLRSAAHGFAVLEAGGGFGFPEDLNASYERLIHMIITGLRTP